METGALVVFFPALSVATAVNVYVPVVALLQVYEYGLVVSCPSLVAPW